jgi:hypothetical protein
MKYFYMGPSRPKKEKEKKEGRGKIGDGVRDIS